MAQSILKSWKRKGKEPTLRKPVIRFSPLLTKLEGERLRIALRPREFIYLNLTVGEYQRKFLGKPYGMITMTEEYVIIPFKTKIEEINCNNAVALDINETNISAVTSDGKVQVFDTKEVKRLHDCYFEIRREIQSKYRGNAKKRALIKYRGREKRRVRVFLHKLSKKIVDAFRGYDVVMEDLRNLRKSIDCGRRLNRRLNSWNFRFIQFLIDYKAKLNGSKVIYVNPKGTSKNCSICGGTISPKDKACPRCGVDRHVNACLNMLKMWGASGSPNTPLDDMRGEVEIFRHPELFYRENL
ncbi:MAG: transposase [Candidatus Bathyarchaeia archaeon]